MKLAQTVFFVAGLYGIATIVPTYFLEARIGVDHPPPITHPEFFYGFLGVALAWQALFFLIAADPPRYRAVMPFAILEKVGFGIAAVALFLAHRVAGLVLGLGIVDLAFVAVFVLAWASTPRVA